MTPFYQSLWSSGTTMATNDNSKPSTQSLKDTSPSEQLTPDQLNVRTPVFSQRSFKQLGFYFAGVGFLSLATLVTRRAVVRKRLATVPRFYTQSNQQVEKKTSDDSMIAIEALGLATLNVVGFGIMATGGVCWAFDISCVDDLRRRTRKHLYGDYGKTDEDAEREVQEWVAKILSGK